VGDLPRPILAGLIVAALALAAVPLLGERFHVQLVTQMMVLAIFALSLDLLVGFTGLVSFGHAAFFGLAGYSLAILTRDVGMTAIWATLPLTLAACGFAALVIGWLSIRTSGIYFIMVTLAFAQMLHFFFNDARGFGGSDGLYINIKPRLAWGDTILLDLQNRTTLYYVTLSALICSVLILKALLTSPFGRVVCALRINEGRTRALGFPVARYKLASFVTAGVLAGLAGYIGAAQFGYVNPAHLAWRESGRVLMVVILGGTGTLFGPVLGAFIFVLLEDVLSSLTEHWLLILGLFVIAVVLILPNGIAGLLLKVARRADHATRDQEIAEPPIDYPLVFRTVLHDEAILETENLTKRFSGLVAVKGVSLRFVPGQVHAIIGPNGAGKTTLINLLSGELGSTEGRIVYKGCDITGASPDIISRMGIGRSFQVSNLYLSQTCLQNCLIAAQSRLPSSMRLYVDAPRLADVRRRAQHSLDRCQLASRHHSLASELSHGDRRKLEIAMVLATDPALFLLDEPLAGMGAHESREIVDLLRIIAGNHTLILIEHDMDAVFSIADTLTVLVNGEVIASGPTEKIRADRAVQDSYLGHRDAAE
jgi:branched-chain amino acid transport system permease protein